MLFDIIWIWLLSSHNSRQFHMKSQTICEKNQQQHDLVKSFKKCGLSKALFLFKKKYIDPALRFMLFFFSGKKTPWDVTGNLDLYMYIYIYMDFDSLFFFGRWIAVLSALGQQIDGFCWPCFNRKGLRRKGLLFVLHMIRDAVIGCHSSSGVNQAFVSNRCSITNQIFKDQYVSFPKYIRPIQCIYGKMSILWKLEIVFSYDILPIYIA